MRKKVVIFSAFFPPDRHIAVSRVEAYAKYLATDHDITVITFGQEDKVVNYDFGNGTFCKVYYVASNNIVTSLLFYTGQESRFLHKLKTLFRVAFNHLNMSHFSTWAKKSKKILEKELENNKIDVLISSYAPEDILEVSYQVLSNLSSSNIKWVVDMRDEYSDEIGLTQWIKEKRRKNELKYSEYIDLLITVSEPLVDLFKRRMPKAKEYIELRNGFDHNYEIAEYKKDRILKIGYFGSLHGDARPDIFFLALQELKLHNKVQVFFCCT